MDAKLAALYGTGMSRLLKVAVIRDPTVPPGAPAPLWLNCPCGAKPATTWSGPPIRCACGVVYSRTGRVLTRPTGA
jgi:hypothetical protein